MIEKHKSGHSVILIKGNHKENIQDTYMIQNEVKSQVMNIKPPLENLQWMPPLPPFTRPMGFYTQKWHQVAPPSVRMWPFFCLDTPCTYPTFGAGYGYPDMSLHAHHKGCQRLHGELNLLSKPLPQVCCRFQGTTIVGPCANNINVGNCNLCR
jgi:hypothetical protein